MKTKEEIEAGYAELMRKAESQFEKNLLQKEMEMKIRHIEQGFDAEQNRNENSITCVGCGS